jgi:hypothetical protein
VELSLFDEVADALRGMAPPDLGTLRVRARHYGIKAWFGPEAPPREHYEAQVIGPKYVPRASVLALEIGFHAEHPKVADNDAVITYLATTEKRWRRVLGDDAIVGGFLGRGDVWRRVSETWPDPNLHDGRLVIELAGRLTDYIRALEPARRAADDRDRV